MIWVAVWLRAVLSIASVPCSASQHLPLPDPPYDFDELEPDFDGAVTRRHHREVFGNHVKAFNRVLRHLRHTDAYRKILKHGGIDGLLLRMDEVPSSVRPKLRQHAGGYVNHELFFRTLRPSRGRSEDQKENAPQEGLLLTAMEHTFGSFKTFKEQFSEMAWQVVGAGWVWLVVDSALAHPPRNSSSDGSSDWAAPQLRILETEKNDHVLQVSPSHVPLLCLDVWEHAYFGQFYNDRQKYIDAWWNLVNWDEVGDILASAALSFRIGTEDSTAVDQTPQSRAETEGFVMAEVVEDPVDDAVASSSPTVVKPSMVASGMLGMANFRNSCAAIGEFLSALRPGGGFGFGCSVIEPCPPCRVAVSSTATAPGVVIASWSAEQVVVPSPSILQRDVWNSAGSLSRLAATLLVENRRENSTWHNYLEFLHDEFNIVRRSALFWTNSLLGALNATLGLDDLLLGARTHREVMELFQASPRFMSADGEPQQQLFDAEIHWAVTVSLCRGIASSDDLQVMLPSSELILRGDSKAANVALRKQVTQLTSDSEAVGEVSWQLVATRQVNEGAQLVLDGGVSDLELLARGWAAVAENSKGPTLRLDALFGGAAGMQLLEEKAQSAPRRWKEQWRDWRCDDELRDPRLHHHGALSFSKGLVMCIALAIRLLENVVSSSAVAAPSAASEATAPLPRPATDLGDSAESLDGDGLEPYSSNAEVLYSAYQLVIHACQLAAERYRRAQAILRIGPEGAPGGSRISQPQSSALDLEVTAELSKLLTADVDLLDLCVAQADERAERQRRQPYAQGSRPRPRPWRRKAKS